MSTAQRTTNRTPSGSDNTYEVATSQRQPAAVWAVALAAAFAFMGIGLVDPILPAIAKNLEATPAQTSLLFTSYLVVTAVMMLVTGALSSRIGGKKTLLLGLGLIVVFAALAGTSNNVGQLIGYRAGWGLGNALFAATSLAVIVAVAIGGKAKAIILYEAALGVGMAVGPLVGALLGGWHWRGPFFGTSALMLIAFLALVAFLPEVPKPAKKVSVVDPLRALRHPGLLGVACSAFFYFCGFFTVLAFTPFVLGFGEYGIGGVFFGWGTALALCSVFLAPIVQRWFGTTWTTVGTLVLMILDMVATALFVGAENTVGVVCMTILIGALMGINNTMYTELAMTVSPAPQPTASAGYNAVRWLGGAIAAWAAPRIGEVFGNPAPYWVMVGILAIAVVLVLAVSGYIHRAEEPEIVTEEEPVTPAD